MPLHTTPRGISLTVESTEAAETVLSFENDLIDLTQGVDRIPELAKRFPETAMVQACAASYYLYGQDTNALEIANDYLTKAEALASTTTPREQNFIQALRHFQQNRFEKALSLLESQTFEYPGDLLAAKISEFLYYCLGQHHNAQRFLAHMQRMEDACQDSAGYWAMRSFATELSGNYSLAAREADRSLALNPIQPWAHHTLAHIQSRSGDTSEIDQMEAHLTIWRQANRGIHSHNAWHLALLQLDQLNFPRVHQLIRSDLWGITPDTIFEQLDTISILWRLDLCGQPADEALWNDVASRVVSHAGQCIIPFIEGHFAYALARSGHHEQANFSVQQAHIRSLQSDYEAIHIWKPVGAPFVAACAALGRGDHQHALSLLEPIVDLIPLVGGSDAQDDLFRIAYIAALTQTGQHQQARQTWSHYFGSKHQTPFDQKLF